MYASEGVDVISADAASDVFQALPDPSDGAVLKRDLLGIGPSSPRLIAAISAVEFSAAPDFGGTSRNSDGHSGRSTGSRNCLRGRSAPSPAITRRTRKRCRRGSTKSTEPSSRWPTSRPSRRNIRTTWSPTSCSREKTSSTPTLFLSSQTTFYLGSSRMVRPALGSRRHERDASARHGRSRRRDDLLASRTRFPIRRRGLLREPAPSVVARPLSHHVGTILAANWLPQLKSTREFAAALSILRYPRNLAKGSAEIAQRLSEMVDDAQGDERTTMQAALLRICDRRGIRAKLESDLDRPA